MSSKYNSSSNKRKVTKQDIINDTTTCNIENDVTLSNTLPDIVTYTMLKHPEYNDVILDNDMIDCLLHMTNNSKFNTNNIKVALWREQNKLFDACIKEYIQINIDGQEMDMILDKSKSDNIKMFTMKKWKPEYRDNVLPQTQIGTVINIKLIDNEENRGAIKDITSSEITKSIEQ